MSDRTTNYIDKLSNADNVDNVLWLFGAPLQNLADSVVDAKIRDNVEWQGKAGIPATVTRTTVGRTCEWCQEVAGSYTYPDVPADVWRRHERCNCIIKYTPAGGGRVDILRGRRSENPKKWYQASEEELEARKKFDPTLKLPPPAQLEFIQEINDFPKLLGIYESPRQLYDELARRGFDVKPLSRGHFGGVEFDNGGGFKVNYGGDGILQYHPKEYSRYGGAYYKVSNGKNGTRRYTMGGDLIVRNVSKNNK